MRQQMLKPTLPWWRVPTVWLVIGGPPPQVLAIHGGDTPLRETATAQSTPLTPATQARNHVVAAPRR